MSVWDSLFKASILLLTRWVKYSSHFFVSLSSRLWPVSCLTRAATASLKS